MHHILEKKRTSTRNSQDIQVELKEVRKSLVKKFRNSMVGHDLVSEEFEEILKRQLKKEIDQFSESRQIESQKEHKELAERLSQFIQDRLADNFYEDINEFLNDIEELEKSYNVY